MQKQNKMDKPLVRYLNFIVVGTLSMLFAEVYSGSSPFWVFSPYSIVVTFTLYLVHILFFINIAFHFRRTSFEALYFLGVIFGLYEAWITTVIVVGYINTTPILGAFFDIAIAEFLMLVFFWHPIMSFIMPLLLFQIFSLTETGTNTYTLPALEPLLTKNKITIAFSVILTLLGSSILASYVKYDLYAAMVSSVSSVVIVLLTYVITKLLHSKFSIFDLKLNKIELIIVIIILAILYIIPFPPLRGQPLVSLPTLMIIFAFYAIAALLFARSKPTPISEPTPGIKEKAPHKRPYFTTRDVFIFFLAFIVLTPLMIFIQPLSIILYYISLFLIIIPLGILLFLRNAIVILKS